MTTTDVRSNEASGIVGVTDVDMKVEVVVIPVADVDRAKSFGCGSSGRTSRGLWDDVLGVAGLVDAVTFLGEVVVPVVVEVAVAADGAEFEDGLCTG